MPSKEIALHPAEIAKLEADAARSLAEAEQAKAEAKNVLALARGAKLTADREALSLASERRKEAAYLAGDCEHRVYRFNGDVEEKSVDKAIDVLNRWDRLTPECNITIYFNSPGGSVTDGMALYDEIRRLGKTHKVTTIASGMAASMGGVLLQSGTKRVMAKEAWLLIHSPSAVAFGSMGELKDRTGWIEKVNEQIVDIFYTRSKETNAPKKLGRIAIAKRFDRKDWWVGSELALAHGFVDEVI